MLAGISFDNTQPKKRRMLVGGWNLLHNPNMQQLRRNREKTHIAKTALLQTLRIHDPQRSQRVSEYFSPRISASRHRSKKI